MIIPGIVQHLDRRCIVKHPPHTEETGLSCLSIMTSVCPASNGKQTIAKVGRQ